MVSARKSWVFPFLYLFIIIIKIFFLSIIFSFPIINFIIKITKGN